MKDAPAAVASLSESSDHDDDGTFYWPILCYVADFGYATVSWRLAVIVWGTEHTNCSVSMMILTRPFLFILSKSAESAINLGHNRN